MKAIRLSRRSIAASAAGILCGTLMSVPAFAAAPVGLTAALRGAYPGGELPAGARADAAAGPATITIGSSGISAVVRVEVADAAGITVSTTGDAVGSPVDFARYVATRRIASRPAAPSDMAAFEAGILPTSLPVAATALTSGFGMRAHPLLDVRRLHAGVDLAAPTGSPIVAPSDGTVRAASWHGGYGMFVQVDHGGGIETRYGHMSRLNVVAGQRVHAGDLLGLVGSTGLSTGPHLHYEVRVNGRPINPLQARAKR